MKLAYLPRTIIKQFVIALVAACLACYLTSRYDLSIKLNFESMIEAFVNLNAGIIIAIFLALFSSSNSNITNFKKFVRAARQVYALFLINSAIVCSTSLFIVNVDSGQIVRMFLDQQSMNIIFSTIAIVFSFSNLRLVYSILKIAFRQEGTQSS